MTDVNKLKEILLELEEIKNVQFLKSVPSAVTTSWSEEIWTEDMIARDSIQNFYDGVIENNIEIDKIDISIVKDTIKIYATNEFNLEKL